MPGLAQSTSIPRLELGNSGQSYVSLLRRQSTREDDATRHDILSEPGWLHKPALDIIIRTSLLGHSSTQRSTAQMIRSRRYTSRLDCRTYIAILVCADW